MIFSLVEVMECNICLPFVLGMFAPVPGKAVPCLRCLDEM